MRTEAALADRTIDNELAGLDALELAANQRESPGTRIWRATWPKVAALVIFFGGWQLLVWSGWKPRYALAAPSDAFSYMGDIYQEGILWEAIRTTMWRAIVGFAISIVVGVVIGILVARVQLLRTAVGSMISGIQTMPSVAWVPISLLLFQNDYEKAILLVMLLGATPSVANGIIGGADHIPPVLLRAGRVLGARGLTAYRHVILPAALPSFVTGLKQGWAFLWRSLMAAELIAGATGSRSVGYLLDANRNVSKSEGMLGSMIIIFVIGVLVDALVFTQLDKAIRKRYGLIDAAAR